MKRTTPENNWRMKVVGRRAVGPATLDDAQRLLKTAWALRGTVDLVPRGLYRFRSFEEADQWMIETMARTFARRRSAMSPASAARSTNAGHATS